MKTSIKTTDLQDRINSLSKRLSEIDSSTDWLVIGRLYNDTLDAYSKAPNDVAPTLAAVKAAWARSLQGVNG